MNLDVARYLDTRGALPPARERGYDYVLAGNGLFKRARSRHVEVMACIAPAQVAGLPAAVAYVKLLDRRLPERFLETAHRDALRWSRRGHQEAMYHVLRTEQGGAQLRRPRQAASGAGVAYAGGGDPRIVCDLHSHSVMRAFFSTTDDRDEVGMRFYAVIGRVETRPEIVVRLGVYGDFVPVPACTVFAGLGPFVDRAMEVRDGGYPAAWYGRVAAVADGLRRGGAGKTARDRQVVAQGPGGAGRVCGSDARAVDGRDGADGGTAAERAASRELVGAGCAVDEESAWRREG